ncbi:orotate phosphoribosyltransferase [Streptomyces nigra]|uniref:orotate phosphoribosyltransferase n=1 Tax=Streptomyces nigra TaxID=1827580 RepID=UPI0036B79147
MSLDQELAAGDDIVTVFVDPGRRFSELRADLMAAGRRTAPTPRTTPPDPIRPGTQTLDSYAFQTRPTVLRRLAALMADLLPERLDRLIAATPDDTPLTTAIALHTGLAYALAEVPADHSSTAGTGLAVRGEIHRGERIAVVTAVTATGTSALRTADAARAAGTDVAAVLTAVDRDIQAAARLALAGHELRPLFTAVHPH